MTLALVASTILLGVATKANGAGLACEANWPQCDAGPYNLFPATLPSFYEWFHRFVAMFAGFGIIGSALAAWRSAAVDNRVTSLVVLGMVLTPVQVALGRATVLQYEMEILSLHFWTAMLIFSVFVIATVLVWAQKLTATHVTGALGLGLLALPVHVVLSPSTLGIVTEYSPTIQLLQYGVTLTLLASVIVATMVGRWRFNNGRLFGLLVGSAGITLAVIFLGRRAVMTFSPALDQIYLVLSVALFVTLTAGIWTSRSISTPSRGAGSP